MSDLLNPSQSVALAVVLQTLEQNLREAKLWLSGEGIITGALYRTTLRVSEERKKAALEQIAQALEMVAQLGEQLQLNGNDVDLGRRIAGTLSVCWANLADVRAQKLRRYGAVDPRLEMVLDPSVERLATLALSIASLVSGAAR